MFFQKFSLSMQAFGVYILFSPLLYVNGLIFHPPPPAHSLLVFLDMSLGSSISEHIDLTGRNLG